MLIKYRMLSSSKAGSSRKAQKGITIVEYAIGASLIAASVLVAFGALGNQMIIVFNTISTGIG